MRRLLLPLLCIVSLLSTLTLTAQNGPVSDIFDRYEWLSGIISPTDCGNASISEYELGGGRYLFIQHNNTGRLYFQNGNFLCENSATTDCVSDYELSLGNRLIDTWNCTSAPQCNNEGQIFFQNCGGQNYYLLRTADGHIYDPYLASNVSYTPVNGQWIRYGFTDIKTNTPCTNAKKTVLLTCVEIATPPPGNLFDRYPWLSALISPTNCTAGSSVYEYDRGGYKYIFINFGSIGKLYYQSGLLLCQDTPTSECVFTYGLGSPINQWDCPVSSGCNISITNNECRVISIFDENNNLLVNIDAAPQPIVGGVSPVWTDSRYLEQGATRTYIFKENNLELGRRTASCSNANISVLSNQSGGCTDVLQQAQINNTGCKTITIEGTNGEVLNYIQPGQSISLDFGFRIYIFKVSGQILEILSTLPSDANGFNIDSGGCEELPTIFIKFPWLKDIINPNNCTAGRIEAYNIHGKHIVRISYPDGRPAIYYNENGWELCRSNGVVNCLDLLHFGNDPRPVDSWTCPPRSFIEEYPFLAGILRPGVCNGYQSVAVYSSGGRKSIYVRKNENRGLLFLEDGTFYCSSTPNYDCLTAYGLSSPIRKWRCTDFHAATAEDRASSSSASNGLDFTVYPNPTIDQLTVQLPLTSEDGYELSVHNVFGRTVHQMITAPAAESVQLSMAAYENGVYYVKLRTKGLRGVQKVVKQGME